MESFLLEANVMVELLKYVKCRDDVCSDVSELNVNLVYHNHTSNINTLKIVGACVNIGL